jgi:hypothetical protein
MRLVKVTNRVSFVALATQLNVPNLMEFGHEHVAAICG